MDCEIHREASEAARAAESVTVSAKLLDELLTAAKDVTLDHFETAKLAGVDILSNTKGRRAVAAIAAVQNELRKAQ